MTEIKPRVIEAHFSTVEDLEKTFNETILKGGYFHPCEDPSPRTTPVELRFILPGLEEPFKITGEVAYAATRESPMPGLGAGMAIQFAGITDSIKKAFRAAITIARSEGMPAPLSPASNEPGEWEEETDEAEEGEEQKAAELDENSTQKLMMRMNSLTAENLYSLLRGLPLHQKIVAAKRGNRNVRAILIQEGNKKIMAYLMQNPQLGPAEVIQMLKMSNLSLEVINMISKNTAFNQNEDIKYLLCVHPKTPLPMSLTLLNAININNLAKIAKSSLKAQLKSSAVKLLEIRRKKS